MENIAKSGNISNCNNSTHDKTSRKRHKFDSATGVIHSVSMFLKESRWPSDATQMMIIACNKIQVNYRCSQKEKEIELPLYRSKGNPHSLQFPRPYGEKQCCRIRDKGNKIQRSNYNYRVIMQKIVHTRKCSLTQISVRGMREVLDEPNEAQYSRSRQGLRISESKSIV